MSEQELKEKLENLNKLRQDAIDACNAYNNLVKDMGFNSILGLISAEQDLESDEEDCYYDNRPIYNWVVNPYITINGKEFWFPSDLNC